MLLSRTGLYHKTSDFIVMHGPPPLSVVIPPVLTILTRSEDNEKAPHFMRVYHVVEEHFYPHFISSDLQGDSHWLHF